MQFPVKLRFHSFAHFKSAFFYWNVFFFFFDSGIDWGNVECEIAYYAQAASISKTKQWLATWNIQRKLIIIAYLRHYLNKHIDTNIDIRSNKKIRWYISSWELRHKNSYALDISGNQFFRHSYLKTRYFTFLWRPRKTTANAPWPISSFGLYSKSPTISIMAV